MITPLDIQNKEFSKAVRGYKEDDVDSFLDLITFDLERLIILEFEDFDELDDIISKKLVIELMGKHSNIIFVNSDDVILDSIKHISANISSVREVLPGRTYTFPPSKGKHPLASLTTENFYQHIKQKYLRQCIKFDE